jgi:uncharacterized protein with PIN domain
MGHAYIRFYSELKDFLSVYNKQIPVRVEVAGHETVKHIVEMLGVPHTEVDLLLVNGKSVDFDYKIRVGEYISVYPMFESLDIRSISKVRQEPLRIPRFVVDIHLGKLASYLRLLGFDTLYRNDFQDDELAELSSEEIRILLTRDRGLLKRKIVTRGYLVRENDPKEQIREIVRRFDLSQLAVPYSRCSLCNGLLSSVSKKAIEKDLQPLTKEHYHHYKQCPDCHQIYWKGSHFAEIENFIRSILNNNQETSI